MYSIKCEKDIPYILKYHRAKDMVNIMKYFPGLSPIDDLVVIKDKNDYIKNRDERISYLESCGLSKELLEENISKSYKKIPDFIWLDIIKNIIKPLEKEEDLLRSYKFIEFNLSGHTEGKRFRPWQMVDDKRL